MTPITDANVSVYTIPTDGPESDGTLEWTSTTIVIVEVRAGGTSGLGYTYGHQSVATLVSEMLFPAVRGRDAMHIGGGWVAMTRAIRNQGRPGIASMAIAAVDTALWDLKARLLDIPLVTLLGAAQDAVPVYGSGGFTSYSIDRLQRQLAGWVERGGHLIEGHVRPTLEVVLTETPRHLQRRFDPESGLNLIDPR